jgi:hypothetical protein
MRHLLVGVKRLESGKYPAWRRSFLLVRDTSLEVLKINDFLPQTWRSKYIL